MSEVEKFIDQLRGLQYIVINECHGGFSLSERASLEYQKLAGITDPLFYDRDIPRDDPYLVKIVREMGVGANGPYSNLKIVEVPGGVKWIVQDYDGAEWVAEEHRTWT